MAFETFDNIAEQVLYRKLRTAVSIAKGGCDLIEESFDNRRPVQTNQTAGPVTNSGQSGFDYYIHLPPAPRMKVGEWIRETRTGKIILF